MYCYVSLTKLWLCFFIFPHKLQREQEISWPSSHDDLLKHSQLGFLWVYQDISRLKTATVMKDLEIGDSPQKVTRRNAKAKETFSYIFMKQAFANVWRYRCNLPHVLQLSLSVLQGSFADKKPETLILGFQWTAWVSLLQDSCTCCSCPQSWQTYTTWWLQHDSNHYVSQLANQDWGCVCSSWARNSPCGSCPSCFIQQIHAKLGGKENVCLCIGDIRAIPRA